MTALGMLERVTRSELDKGNTVTIGKHSVKQFGNMFMLFDGIKFVRFTGDYPEAFAFLMEK